MRESIKDVLMRRDGMSAEEADILIEETKDVIDYYVSEGDIFGAESIFEEYLGLEPDFMDELMF